MQQSVLLCISTILDSGNHYSKMVFCDDTNPIPNPNPNPNLNLNADGNAG